MIKTIVKDYDPTAVVNTKDNPIYKPNFEVWEQAKKISKIYYNVGDDCVFEITRGNKKWTIPLDKFFDKVIFRKRLFIYIAMIGWYDDFSKNRHEIKIIFS